MTLRKGFTIFELIILIGILAILISITSVFSNTTLFHSLELERAREDIHGELIRAQTDANANTNDTDWGVAFFPQSITRFGGASFATRNQSFDITTSFSAPVIISGDTEIVFTRPEGIPNAPATINITIGTRSATISINATGSISVQ